MKDHTMPAPTAGPPPRRGTILVVDDEDAIRQLIANVFERLGFTTVTAPDGPTAITLAQTHSADLICAVLDIMMPQMDGITAANAIQQIVPHVPIVLMSGYSTTQVIAQASAVQIAGFLPKPFTLSQLRTMIEQVTAP
jgi:two-component system cell cycle sensor histidine kinase/response regulator CckA